LQHKPQYSKKAMYGKIVTIYEIAVQYCLGNTAQCGKSRFRENLSSDDGTFSQMYFVYLKKK